MTTIEALLSVEAAARLLGLSPWTVRLYIRNGKINSVRIGRRVLVEPSELQRLIASGRKVQPEKGGGMG